MLSDSLHPIFPSKLPVPDFGAILMRWSFAKMILKMQILWQKDSRENFVCRRHEGRANKKPPIAFFLANCFCPAFRFFCKMPMGKCLLSYGDWVRALRSGCDNKGLFLCVGGG